MASPGINDGTVKAQLAELDEQNFDAWVIIGNSYPDVTIGPENQLRNFPQLEQLAELR